MVPVMAKNTAQNNTENALLERLKMAAMISAMKACDMWWQG